MYLRKKAILYQNVILFWNIIIDILIIWWICLKKAVKRRRRISMLMNVWGIWGKIKLILRIACIWFGRFRKGKICAIWAIVRLLGWVCLRLGWMIIRVMLIIMWILCCLWIVKNIIRVFRICLKIRVTL